MKKIFNIILTSQIISLIDGMTNTGTDDNPFTSAQAGVIDHPILMISLLVIGLIIELVIRWNKRAKNEENTSYKYEKSSPKSQTSVNKRFKPASGKELKIKYAKLLKRLMPFKEKVVELDSKLYTGDRMHVTTEIEVGNKYLFLIYSFNITNVYEEERDYADFTEEESEPELIEEDELDGDINYALFNFFEEDNKIVLEYCGDGQGTDEEACAPEFSWKFKSETPVDEIIEKFLNYKYYDTGIECVKKVIDGTITEVKKNPFYIPEPSPQPTLEDRLQEIQRQLKEIKEK